MLNDAYKISMFDIKLDNIMLVNQTDKIDEAQFVLVDFGLAASMTHDDYEWTTSGTFGYVCYVKLIIFYP